ncbi:MAG: sel1 repeat family protein, partial [Gammaproteobacteria bacterium]|nr:sel1 repeat family protein [Gammaproteobacteria bacterium]
MMKRLLIMSNYCCAIILVTILVMGILVDHIVEANDSGSLEEAKRAIRLKDYSLAASLYRSSALDGDTDAMCQLGVLYQMGRGVPKDHAKAIEWYKKAAVQGHVKAQFNLGAMYESGWGTTPDYRMAYYCYLKAAAQGHDRAESKCNMLRDGGLLMLGN